MSPKSTRTARRCIATAAAFEPLEKRELMSAGALDTSFGTAGKLTSQALPFAPVAVAMQKDGKTIAVGKFSSDFAVARLNVNGTIDTTFGPHADGIARANFGSGDDTARAVVVQPNGKIVVVGEDHDHNMAIARFNTDGLLDNSFNRGLKEFDFHLIGGGGGAYAVALQADGKIVVGGTEDESGLFGGTNNDFAVARLNTNGDLDGSFGDDGKMHFGMGDKFETVKALTVQSGGKIVIAGSKGDRNHGRMIAARLNANGSLDKTFDKDGSATADFGVNASAFDVAVGPGNTVLVVGAAGNDATENFGLLRFTESGKVDPFFGNGSGMVTTDFGGDDFAHTATITPDNQILVGGQTGGNFAIARYDIGGNIDTSFGTNGIVNTGFGGFGAAMRLSTTADGKLVATGSSNFDLVQSRYSATQPKVSVTSIRSTTEEGGDKASFTFTRDQALSFPTRVYYSLGGTASLNADYTGPTFAKRFNGNITTITRAKPLAGKIIGGGGLFSDVPYVDIAAGQMQASVTIKASDDEKFEPNETITATLSTDANYTTDNSAASQTVTILDDDALHINFQAQSTKTAGAYLADTGNKFGDRGNGQSYGWDKDNTSKMRNRNSTGSADFRYDSLALMQASGGSGKWELAVPNGRYEVRLVAGDANFTDSKYKMNLEGQRGLTGDAGGNVHWFRSTSIVDVTDGRLTLTNGSGAQNNKIDWIDIKAAPLGAAAGAVTGASNLPVNLFTNSTQGQRGTDGLFSDTQLDDRQIWAELKLIRI